MPANNEIAVIDRGDTKISYDAAPPLKRDAQKRLAELQQGLVMNGDEQAWHSAQLAELKRDALDIAAQLKALRAGLAAAEVAS